MDNKGNRTCCVRGCSQATRTWMAKNTISVTFHCLPRQKEVRSKWLEALQRANGMDWVAKRDTRVCSLHFGEYCWETARQDGKRKLRWSAVPLHFTTQQTVSTPHKRVFAFDHPYCSGAFKKRKSLADITNNQGGEHTYSRKDGPHKKMHPEKLLPTSTTNHSLGDTSSVADQFRQKSYLQYLAYDQFKQTSYLQTQLSCSAAGLDVMSSCTPHKVPVNEYSASMPEVSFEGVVCDTSLPVCTTPITGLDLLASCASQMIPMNDHSFSMPTILMQEVCITPPLISSTTTTGVDALPNRAPQMTSEDEDSFSTSAILMQEVPPPTSTCSSATAVQSQLSAGRQDLRDCNQDLHGIRASQSERERFLDSQLASAHEQNRLLTKKLASMERLANKLNKENINLRGSNRVVTRRNVALRNRCENLEKNISAVFHRDQVEAMGRKSTQGLQWGPETVKDALIFKMKCGTAGYEEIRKKLPFPSARTLQNHIQHIPFESGILDEVFDMILVNIKNRRSEELDCMIAADEMSIDPSEMIDPSSKQPIGHVTLKSHDGIANKALVFILGGISSRWKQTVAYYFTRAKAEQEDSDAVGRELAAIVTDIIKRAEAIGLRVHSVTTDMGPENQAMWRALGVRCSRTNCVYAVPHPVRMGDFLYIVPDVPHLFKSFKRMLIANGSIFLPDDIVREENLPTNEVKACHLKDLLDFQGDMELKIAPKLKEECLTPTGHFQGMKVGNARGVISRRTATGLQVLALQKQDPSYITSAWFINHVNRWFELMTSRSHKLALSKAKLDKYNEAIHHLETTIRIFTGMRVGKTGSWKPVQTGFILATSSILHLQDHLLNSRGFKYVLTARLSQDFLENLFSSVRARQSTPNALAFKHTLKVVTIAQYCREVPGSSYDHDDGEYLLDFVNYTKDKAAERKLQSSEAELWFEIPRATNADIESFPLEDRLVMYDLFGAVMQSVKKTNKVCETCFGACLHDGADPHPYSVVSQLNSVAEGALVMVSEECYRALAKAELVFRSCKKELMAAKINVQQALVKSWSGYVWEGSNIPNCHCITTKILWRYVRMRWRIHGQRSSEQARDAVKAVYGSRSMAMRRVVQ